MSFAWGIVTRAWASNAPALRKWTGQHDLKLRAAYRGSVRNKSNERAIGIFGRDADDEGRPNLGHVAEVHEPDLAAQRLRHYCSALLGSYDLDGGFSRARRSCEAHASRVFRVGDGGAAGYTRSTSSPVRRGCTWKCRCGTSWLAPSPAECQTLRPSPGKTAATACATRTTVAMTACAVLESATRMSGTCWRGITSVCPG